MVTTTNLDKMNKMRGTAREMTEAQRDSNRAPTENLVAVQKRGVGLAQGGMEFLRLQEQNTKAAQQWIAASMKVAQLQQRSVRFAQEWMHNGAGALREQTEHNLRTAESIVEGWGSSPGPCASCPYSPEWVEGSNVLREEGAGLAMGHVKASANASVKP